MAEPERGHRLRDAEVAEVAEVADAAADGQAAAPLGPNYARAELETAPLLISHEQLERICKLLEEEFKRGLHRDTNAAANIKMYPTHLIDRQAAAPARKWANTETGVELEAEADAADAAAAAAAAQSGPEAGASGHFAEPEAGKFLALDLGGTNFRVILLELDGTQFHMDNETYSLSRELMHGPGRQLFDYIADCLASFVARRQLAGSRLPLGFTFSFPVQQEGLAHARLVNWTKGFKCPDVEGRDVVGLLSEAIERRPDLDIEVMAVVNDTTGTLISCAFKNRECRIGLIVGTGTNACYMEEVDNVHAMQPTGGDGGGGGGENGGAHTTVINTEWGAFGDNGALDFVRTCWDEQIDANSLNEGKQKFEKMISGLYIGELCRRVLQHLALERALLFRQTAPELLGETLAASALCKQFSFETRFVSMVEGEPPAATQSTRRALLEAFAIDWASEEDCAIVKLVCRRVSTRAAHLVSAAVACLLNKMARPFTVVGVDGSMFKYHPHFRSIMAQKTGELTRPGHRFQLMFSEDGSGKGAAIVASVACKQRRISGLA